MLASVCVCVGGVPDASGGGRSWDPSSDLREALIRSPHPALKRRPRAFWDFIWTLPLVLLSSRPSAQGLFSVGSALARRAGHSPVRVHRGCWLSEPLTLMQPCTRPSRAAVVSSRKHPPAVVGFWPRVPERPLASSVFSQTLEPQWVLDYWCVLPSTCIWGSPGLRWKSAAGFLVA